jgi:hypothetical protein
MTPTPWQPRVLTIRQKRAWSFVLRFVLPVVILIVVILLAVFSPSTLPQEQWEAAKIKEREDAHQALDRQQQASDRQKTLCRLLSLCSKFGDARQACATAGNYKMCIDIKMGADAMDRYPCKNDGAVFDQPNDMPTAFECLWTKLR